MFIIYVAIWRFTTAFDESILKISVKNRWASAKLFWPRWRNALENKWHINEFSSKTQGNNTFKKEWTPFFIFPVTDVRASDICYSQCEGDADLQTNGMTTWITQLLYFLPMKATVFINLNAYFLPRIISSWNQPYNFQSTFE